MRTEKQKQASRQNGARSLGPATAQGKRNSSVNALRHGLLAGTLVLQAEQREPFLRLHREILDTYQPATPVELQLVETMTSARWRLLRLWGMETTRLNDGIQRQEGLESSEALRAAHVMEGSSAHFLRYETALDRQYHRALGRLETLQKERRKTVPKQPDPPTSPRTFLVDYPSIREKGVILSNEPGNVLKNKDVSTGWVDD